MFCSNLWRTSKVSISSNGQYSRYSSAFSADVPHEIDTNGQICVCVPELE